MQIVAIIEKPVHFERLNLAIEPVIFTISAGIMYLAVQKLIHKIVGTDSKELKAVSD